MPKFNFLLFQDLLNLSFNIFFNLYQNDFIKDKNKYILAKNFSILKLTKIFKKIILNILSNNIKKYNIINPNYFIVIGSCIPKNNLFLKYNNLACLPLKLKKLITSTTYNIQFLVKEKDIVVDILKFNEACINIFETFFKSEKKCYSKEYQKNLIFLFHNQIDSKILLKLLYYNLGKNNCNLIDINYKNNIYSEFKNCNSIISINDIIDKHCKFKSINSTIELKNISNEIKTFIFEKLYS